ncbi:MAG: M48 family metalloprotease [Candidatus Fibromonas sp.]|jgi:Zn-dependent protease with chaperone function|nr:M48 family metalloprotease [Candidatus Fibromonas sp.]
MLSHEYFHEQAHIEKQHELKRWIFLFLTFIAALLIYRLFCHLQEFEADRLAMQKCGKNVAFESLRLLQMREGKTGFFANLFSLHPKTEKRIKAIHK